MFIGIDDTDSTEGMCTTYLAPILYEELRECGGILVELPYLVRLNPNIPYKTRGNAAICLKVSLSPENGGKERVEERVMRCVESLAVFSDPRTNPGIVFVDEPDEDAVEDLKNFSKAALHRIVEIDEAVIDTSRRFLPGVSSVTEGDKVKITIGDGVEFLQKMRDKKEKKKRIKLYYKNVLSTFSRIFFYGSSSNKSP